MSIKISQETTVGGWTGFLALTAEDKKIFNETLIGFIGVVHSSLYVSTQTVISGTNYRFKCISSLDDSEAIWESIITIYQPSKGVAHITSIIKL